MGLELVPYLYPIVPWISGRRAGSTGLHRIHRCLHLPTCLCLYAHYQQNIFSMNYAVLVRELSIYLARWLDCQKPHEVSTIRTRRWRITFTQQQYSRFKAKYHFRFYDINSLAITISFIACTSSVKVSEGNSWKQGNKHGNNGSSKS